MDNRTSTRMTARNASIAARNRQSRKDRITRHTVFTLKRHVGFTVRKSLVDYVDKELQDMDTSVFYQRIFILAKNCRLTPVPSVADRTRASQMPAATADQGRSEGDPNTELGDETFPATSDGTQSRNTSEVLTRTFRFDEDEGDVEEAGEEEEQPSEAIPAAKPKDFFTVFTEKLQELHKRCMASAVTPDPLCGIYIHMGDYGLMMLESGEDMLGCFCNELASCCQDYWVANRVFLIEDHIKELYTKDLMFRRIPAVFLNEKFPTSTPTDEYLMGKQHMIIKEKLLTICRIFCEREQQQQYQQQFGDLSDSEEDEAASGTRDKSKISLTSDILPVDIFRKHLPEIQRIELVLASTRFYYDLAEFSGLFGRAPFGPDEDSVYWPIQNNYMPPNVFRRTPYDINLTFSDYAAGSRRPTQTSLLENDDEDEENPA
ncbi:hypothetical protein KR018_001093 [Drosophila ironensis]|nr:hypothetical protein KR018_001093 [Drosophila ironensis]